MALRDSCQTFHPINLADTCVRDRLLCFRENRRAPQSIRHVGAREMLESLCRSANSILFSVSVFVPAPASGQAHRRRLLYLIFTSEVPGPTSSLLYHYIAFIIHTSLHRSHHPHFSPFSLQRIHFIFLTSPTSHQTTPSSARPSFSPLHVPHPYGPQPSTFLPHPLTHNAPATPQLVRAAHSDED